MASFLSHLMGRRVSRWLFSWLGILWFDILRIRRKDVLRHIGIAFPEMSESEKVKMGRTSMRLLTAQMGDFLTLPYITQQWVNKNVVYHGTEHVEVALKEGRGVFLLGMHIGNGDLAANLIALKKWDLHLITKFFKNQNLNKIWFSIRGYHGVKYIEPHGEKTPFQILKALKSNGLVVFVLDQYMGKPFGISSTFFGKKTGTAQGLALFYLKTKAPVVPVYCYEGDDHKTHLVFEPALFLSDKLSEDKEASIARLTQYFCDITEAAIRKHPEQWMWLHRRWKKFE